MQVEGHVANFVKEQRATFGLLKAATARGLRPRESATLVAKKFALEQVLGDRRRVDGHDRATRALAVLVQRMRHQFFARATLASDEHRDVALRQAPDSTEHVLHGRRLT